MKAFILAAGIGSRLKEVTQHTPKCLVQAGGKSLLQHVIEKLKSTGVDQILINLHHHPEQVVAFIKNNAAFGINIAFSYESSLLDTGGGLGKARDFFSHGEPFFVHNTDVYSEIDLRAFFDRHMKSGNDATLAVMQRDSSRGLFLDKNMSLIGWKQEHLQTGAADADLYAFCGIQVVSPALFDFMPPFPSKFSIIETYLAAVRAGRQIKGDLIKDTYWMDVGTAERLKQLDEKLGKK